MAVWFQLVPAIDILKGFYEFSRDLCELSEQLLKVLCNQDPAKGLEENQSLAKLFGQILEFVTKFDQLKVFREMTLRWASLKFKMIFPSIEDL